MLRKRVTAKSLESLGACDSEVARFRKLHGHGLPVSSLSCQVAASEGFDLDWFAHTLFGATALKAYDEAIATAEKVYDKAIAPARQAYDLARATALWAAIQTDQQEAKP